MERLPVIGFAQQRAPPACESAHRPHEWARVEDVREVTCRRSPGLTLAAGRTGPRLDWRLLLHFVDSSANGTPVAVAAERIDSCDSRAVVTMSS